MFDGVFEFYAERIKASYNYSKTSAHDLINMVSRCAFYDSLLTGDEFKQIVSMCMEAHKNIEEGKNHE